MSDECCVHAALAEPLLLEWQNTCEPIHVRAHAFDASFTRRPELRGDVVEHGNSALLRNPRKMQIHCAGINANPKIRLLREIVPAGLLQHAWYFAHAPDWLDGYCLALGPLLQD